MKARAGLAVLILVCLLVASVPIQVQAYNTQRDVDMATITQEAAPASAFFPLYTTIDVTPTSGSWQRVDVSTYVPEGATGVILHYGGGTVYYLSGSIGFRTTGSTDARTQAPRLEDHFWVMVGIDSNKTFECYRGQYAGRVYLVGYTGPGVTFFTNGIEKNIAQGTGWVDIDTSSECPNAIGVILEYTNLSGGGSVHSFGVRKNGSTDDRIGTSVTHGSSAHCWAIVGVDENGIFEGNFPGNWSPNPQRRFYIVGYITSGATFKTNEDNVSLNTTGSYQDIDLSSLAPNSNMAFIEIENTDTSDRAYALRKKGEIGADKDVYKDCSRHDFAFAAVDCNGVLEAKIEHTGVKFHLIGYAHGEVVNLPPVAHANGPYTGVTSVCVTFDGSGSSDRDGTIVSYDWDLDGDGEFDDATGEVVQRMWTQVYSGNISLRVTDDKGATATYTTTATIAAERTSFEEPMPNVTGVTVHINCRASNPDLSEPSGSYLAAQLIRTHNGNYSSMSDGVVTSISLTSQWWDYSYTWSTNPYTSLAWTEEEISGLGIGVWLRTSLWAPDPYTSSWCTQVYADVEYADGGHRVLRPVADWEGYYGNLPSPPWWERLDDVAPDGEASYVLYTSYGIDWMYPYGGGEIICWTSAGLPYTPEMLLQEYAPVLYLHPQEDFLPRDITSMLNESDLRNGEAIPPPITSSVLAAHNEEDYYLDMRNARSDPNYLIPNPARFENYEHVVYGRAYEDASHIVLQYWFFYPYNSWERTYEGILYVGNHHEGDWEMITIVLDKATGTPQWLSCAQHAGGHRYDWEEVEKIGETHPKIFTAQGSHASYATLGSHLPLDIILLYHPELYLLFRYTVDVTSENGTALYPAGLDLSGISGTTSSLPYTIDDISQLPSPSWVQWLGDWGEHSNLWGASGPRSPAQQGDKWDNPVSWSQNPNPSNTICISGSPVHIHAYDQHGNHVGLTETGEIEAKIPGTYIYLPSDGGKELMWIYTEEYLRFEIKATDAGNFDFAIGRYLKSEDKEILASYKDVPITENTIATVEASPDNPDFIMGVDLDGNGTVDAYQKPDEVIATVGENKPPVANANGPYTGITGVPVTLDASGSSDPDGIIVSYEWDLDNDDAFDDASGEVVDYTWAEAYSGNVRLRVTDDGGAIAITTTTATIIMSNRPPELAPVGNKIVDEGQLLSFTISATDPDGDPLTYSASNLPPGASFDPSTQTFSWTPGYDQAGTYANIHFEVSDGTASVFEEITIRVNNCVDLFMHGAAPDLILDITLPSSTSAIYKDSPGVKRTIFVEIGTWNAAPMTETQNLTSLGNLTVWVGLKNSDDQGTYFDIRAEVLKNGAVITSAEVKDIKGITRNPDKATEVVVTFGTIPDTTFAVGDIFSIRVLTKVADTGGHSNAVGLRLYYDSVSRPSWVNTMFYE